MGLYFLLSPRNNALGRDAIGAKPGRLRTRTIQQLHLNEIGNMPGGPFIG
jgi:hypothetical protein